MVTGETRKLRRLMPWLVKWIKHLIIHDSDWKGCSASGAEESESEEDEDTEEDEDGDRLASELESGPWSGCMSTLRWSLFAFTPSWPWLLIFLAPAPWHRFLAFLCLFNPNATVPVRALLVRGFSLVTVWQNQILHNFECYSSRWQSPWRFQELLKELLAGTNLQDLSRFAKQKDLHWTCHTVRKTLDENVDQWLVEKGPHEVERLLAPATLEFHQRPFSHRTWEETEASNFLHGSSLATKHETWKRIMTCDVDQKTHTHTGKWLVIQTSTPRFANC